MLAPAILYKMQLEMLFPTIAFDERYKFYYSNNWVRLCSPSVAENTWQQLQMVGIYNEAVQSYFNAEIDRNNNSVSSISMLKFPDGNDVEFAKDLYEFFSNLFTKFNFNKVCFSVLIGNPAESIYDRLVQRYNGRVVGVYEEDCVLFDGTVCDRKVYEIKNENISVCR